MRIGLLTVPLIAAAALLGAAAACAEDGPRPTTPQGRPALHSSDGAPPGSAEGRGATAGAGGAPRSGGDHRVDTGRGGAGGDGGGGAAAVPSGLDMRGGGGGEPALPRLAHGGGGGAGATSPRTLPPPWIGGPRAKVVLEEFTDFECPFCQTAAKTLKRVLAHYGAKVKLVFRHLPLKFHRQAKLAAQAAVCAQAQGKFWPMQQLLFENHQALTRADLLAYARRLGLDVPRFTRDLDGGACLPRVEADLQEARKRQIEGTPAFFINGTKHEGALPFADFKKLIDAALGE